MSTRPRRPDTLVMETASILTLAFLPVLCLLLYIRYKDRANPEPIGALIKAFVYGCLSLPVSLCLSIPFGMLGLYPEEAASITDSFRDAFFAAAIPEELAKLFMLWLLLRRHKQFDEHIDGIVYAVFVSLGFAAPENLLYLIGDEDYLATGIARAIFAIPGHCCFGILMGYYYSRLAFSPRRRWRNLALLFLAPIIAHGLYDALLMAQEQVPEWVSGLLFLLFIAFCIFMWRLSHRKIKQHLRNDESWFPSLPPIPPRPLPPIPGEEPPPLPDWHPAANAAADPAAPPAASPAAPAPPPLPANADLPQG